MKSLIQRIKCLIVCVLLFFCVGSAISQVNLISDTLIEKKYAETLTEQKAANSQSYLLIKVKAQVVPNFKKQYKALIKRQIADTWFIIKKQSIPEDDLNVYIEKKLLANDYWKLSDALFQMQHSLQKDKPYVFLAGVNDRDALISLVQQHAKQVIILTELRTEKLFRIKATFSFVEQVLIKDSNVTSVDMRVILPKEETVVNDYDNTENSINLFFASYPTIRGDGLCVSVKENLFDTTDIDFKHRYRTTNLVSNVTTSHATTMATLIAGGGNSFFTGKGIAWGSYIASSDFAVLLPDSDSIYRKYGISIQNHSYGVGIENFYGSDAAAYDASMINDTSLLHIFSAGNSGESTPTNGAYAGLNSFANLTGSFKMAKNILTVGSLDSFYKVPSLSSKGPAYDGRIKPELVAYGNDGSSGAAAITSGTALAMQSAYTGKHNGLLPNNALIKAVLINSAQDVFTKGPDYHSGYGNVNTHHAVMDILSGQFFTGLVAQNEIKDFSLTIPKNVKDLKITLVWTDPPALANAYTALVNDLDLSLERNSDNFLWLPWVLNSAADADSLNKPAQRKRDSLNVVEQITIDKPSAGSYTIHVTGHDISNTQSFYVAYRWDTLDHFYFISPAKDDHFTSGGNSIFRWNSTYGDTTTGKLEYSVDKGTTWKLINTNIDLSKKYLKWTAPDTFAIALARMTIGNAVYTSDTFNFSRQLYPTVGFYCEDSVLISWSKIKGIQEYKVYNLGDRYMQPLAVTADTTIIINTSNISSPYVNVTTLFNNNHTGVNSYTFDYTTQGVSCYVSNFLADLNTSNHAVLQLTTGTVYNISEVIFQEFIANKWQTISTLQNINGTYFTYEDDTLHTGINTYRAAVELNNGSIIYSNEASVNYFGNDLFVMFPNPVHYSQKLVVLSNNFLENTLQIYDATGRKVLQQQINNTRSEISVLHLARGIYFVVIFNNNQKLFTRKLLIE